VYPERGHVVGDLLAEPDHQMYRSGIRLPKASVLVELANLRVILAVTTKACGVDFPTATRDWVHITPGHCDELRPDVQ